MLLDLAAAGTLLAWFYLLALRGGYWRADIRLEPASDPTGWPHVAAIIPARNEGATIVETLRMHGLSDYPGRFDIVLIDDHSADGTAELAKAAPVGLRSLTAASAPPLLPGWTGKVAAMNAGVGVAQDSPKYFLFCDADIRFAPSTLRRLVASAERDRLALVSLMARLEARGFWGALLIPAFVYFFQMLYPFRWSNDRSRRTAAAAGGCMLVRRDALQAAGGLTRIRDRLIDDCALARLLKRSGTPIWIGLAREEVASVRDNRSLGSVWSMVARTAFTQLGRSLLMLLLAVAGLAFVFLAPAGIALSYPLHRDEAAGALALAAWLVMSATYLPTVRLYGAGPISAASLPAGAFFYLLMTLSSAAEHARGRGGLWKGRSQAPSREP
jgi:hopene-associated glycosyltransferase HpnB